MEEAKQQPPAESASLLDQLKELRAKEDPALVTQFLLARIVAELHEIIMTMRELYGDHVIHNRMGGKMPEFPTKTEETEEATV